MLRLMVFNLLDNAAHFILIWNTMFFISCEKLCIRQNYNNIHVSQCLRMKKLNKLLNKIILLCMLQTNWIIILKLKEKKIVIKINKNNIIFHLYKLSLFKQKNLLNRY